MKNTTYDFLKKYGLAILTGGATFIITLGEIWNIPYAKQIAATLTAIATFIIFIINNASKKYFEDKEIVGIVQTNNLEEKG